MGVLIEGEICNEQCFHTQPSALPFWLRRSQQIRTAIGASSQSRDHLKKAAIHTSHLRRKGKTLAARHSTCGRPNCCYVCCSASAASSVHDIILSKGRAANPAEGLTLDRLLKRLAPFVGRVALYSALLKLAGMTFAAPPAVHA